MRPPLRLASRLSALLTLCRHFRFHGRLSLFLLRLASRTPCKSRCPPTDLIGSFRDSRRAVAPVEKIYAMRFEVACCTAFSSYARTGNDFWDRARNCPRSAASPDCGCYRYSEGEVLGLYADPADRRRGTVPLRCGAAWRVQRDGLAIGIRHARTACDRIVWGGAHFAFRVAASHASAVGDGVRRLGAGANRVGDS